MRRRASVSHSESSFLEHHIDNSDKNCQCIGKAVLGGGSRKKREGERRKERVVGGRLAVGRRRRGGRRDVLIERSR